MHCRVNVIFMMKFCLNWGGAALLSMLLLCTSCGDADLFDTDKWTNEIEGWEPGVSLKVLQGSFTVWDLINQGDVDVVACVYLVPHDEAVEIRPRGYHSYHSRDYDVHEGEVRHILPEFADQELDVLYGDILLKEVLSIETGAHYEGNNVVNGVDVPYTPAVIAVAEASFESILHLVPPV